MRRRLDVELVSRGFYPTLECATRAVMAGEVSTLDRRLDHPGEQVHVGIPLHVRPSARYVSRGGLKLEHALQVCGVDPEGLSCLDVGCSTGGFTDCLLRHGACSVVAVDVGQAQFDWRLRKDSRVELLERTNICDLSGTGRDGTIDLAVCDVSFTSVTVVLPAIVSLLGPRGALLLLVKPQFEAPRADVGKGGVVRDPAVRLAALQKVSAAFEEAGLVVCGRCESPITGRKGNVEYFLYGVRDVREGSPQASLSARHPRAGLF